MRSPLNIIDGLNPAENKIMSLDRKIAIITGSNSMISLANQWLCPGKGRLWGMVLLIINNQDIIKVNPLKPIIRYNY